MRKKHSKRVVLLPVAALCLAGVAQAQSILNETPSLNTLTRQNADTGDTLQFRVGAGFEHDSNVLRSSNATSDQIGILTAGARFDKRYSLQRITLDAEATTYKFNDFSNLDYSTFNYLGAWNYQITPRFQGTLSAQRRQYRDVTDPGTGTSSSNRRTERNELLEGTYGVGGPWRVMGGLSHNSSKSEDPRSVEASPTVRSVRVGGGYEFPSGASLIAQVRRGDGDYSLGGPGSSFKETEPALVATWPVTARTQLNGRIGHIDRKHDGAPERDFSGLIADLNANYEYSAKTSVAAGLARDLGSYEFAGGGHIKNTRLYIAPLWKATAKTAVRLRWQHERREWDVASAASPDLGREDRTNFTSAAFEWEPRRNLLVTVGVRGERRSSNLPGLDYRATIFGLGAKATF